jgi:hypothetical protein
MSKRKALSKKIRFEVFKRDSFKCQYCGHASPDVILHVDHIHPVSQGGDDDILNLITSCDSCNSGKSDRLLSDSSLIKKQKLMLDELNEKRQQLEMLLEWRNELQQLESDFIDSAINLFETHVERPGCVNDSGANALKKLISKFGIDEVLTCIDIACEQYLERNSRDNVVHESAQKAFDYIGKIASVRKSQAGGPNLSKLYYIRGILKNRFQNWYPTLEYSSIELMKHAIEKDIDIETLQQIAKVSKCWSHFKDKILDAIEEGCYGQDS